MAEKLIKFDHRKACYFETDCPPFGIQKVFFPSDAYRPKMIKKKRFFFFGPVTGIEFGHEFSKAELRETIAELESISSLWSKIWTESLNAIQNHRKQWEYEPFEGGDEFEATLMLRDKPNVRFIIELNGDGRWYVELDRDASVVDKRVCW